MKGDRVIQQFMWGFQPHFRISLELLAARAMKAIGFDADPSAYLIGFAESGDKHWPVCVEPEGRDISADVLASALSLADGLYEAHPERRMMNTDPDTDKRFHQGLRDRCRGTAVTNLLESNEGDSPRRFFVGQPGVVNGYRVFPVIAIVRTAWDDLPRLSKVQSKSRIDTYESLQYALIRHVLDAASRALHLSDPPAHIPDEDADELARRAATDFVGRLTFVHGSWPSGHFRTALDAVAAQPYEGRTGFGRALVGDRATWTYDLEFAKPIKVGDTRSFRKALEMTNNNLSLLTDGVEAFGLGRLLDSYDEDSESCFYVTVAGRGAWELSHGTLPLLRVEDGRASLPKPRLPEWQFADTATRIFGSKCDPIALWNAATTAASQAHGTMLVIHSEAAQEVERLATQGLAVKHTPLSESTLAAVTSIDGAVILGPDGSCHGIGVILDGLAVTGVGDPSRGARFNSALRYAAAHPRTCMIVIVSEDGMIDVLPRLRPRVTRHEVEEAVARVEASASAEDIDFELFHDTESKALKYRFYFSQVQCDLMNQAFDRVNAARKALPDNLIEVGRQVVAVDPDMTDEYFRE